MVSTYQDDEIINVAQKEVPLRETRTLRRAEIARSILSSTIWIVWKIEYME